MKIAYSPLWMGDVGMLGSMIVMVIIHPELLSNWVWWVFQWSAMIVIAAGALVHGHYVWKRQEHYRELIRKLGLEGKRTILLGKNKIGVVED